MHRGALTSTSGTTRKVERMSHLTSTSKDRNRYQPRRRLRVTSKRLLSAARRGVIARRQTRVSVTVPKVRFFDGDDQ